ncbi:MAG: hypothetical protein HY720_08600 [Planctomycetes bacterium]|nr:hypothetical protein [Planctomycetota bacterium]
MKRFAREVAVGIAAVLALGILWSGIHRVARDLPRVAADEENGGRTAKAPGIDLADRFDLAPDRGELYYGAIDLAVHGSGELPGLHHMVAARTYRSMAPRTDSVLGPGWRFSFDTYLTVHEETNQVVLAEGTGDLIPFQAVEGTNRYMATVGSQDSLFLVEGEKWVLASENGGVAVYGETGVLLSTMGPNGHSLFFTSDEKGRATRIQDGLGRSMELAYESERLANVRDSLGREVGFSYDAEGRLARVAGADGTVEEYRYEGEDFLTGILVGGVEAARVSYDRDHRVEEIAGTGVARRAFEYRVEDSLFEVTEEEADGTVIVQTTDRATGTKRVTVNGEEIYEARSDASGRKLTLRSGRNSATYSYDDTGRLVGLQDADGSRDYRYDDFGRLVEVAGPAGRATVQYSDEGRVLRIERPGLPPMAFTYDAKGRLASYDAGEGARSVRYLEEGEKTLIEVAGPGGSLARTRYNGAGLPVEVEYANGLVATFEYDRAGNLVRAGNSLGWKIEFERDGAGNIVRWTEDGNRTTRLGYDGRGRVVERTDAAGGVTRARYDETGREVEITDPIGGTIELAADAADRVTSVKWPDGGAEESEFDEMGRIRTYRTADGEVVEYVYDAKGRRTGVKAKGASYSFQVGEAGKKTGEKGEEVDLAYAYNAVGRIVETTDTELGKSIRYVYDRNGRLEKLETPVGTIEYSRDAQGRITKVSRGDVWVEFTLGGDGLPVETRYSNGAIERRSYDPLGNLTRVEFDTDDDEVRDRTIEYDYDPSGRLVRLRDSEAGETRYEYDALGQLVAAVPAQGEPIRYEYDAAGNRVAESLGSERVSIEVDKASRIEKKGDETYRYDECGRLASKEGPAGTRDFTYDGLGRLVQVKVESGSVVRYGYDSAGRRLWREVDGERTRYLWAGDQLLAQYDGKGEVETSYLFTPDVDDSLAMTTGELTQFFHKDVGGSVRLLSGPEGEVTGKYDYMPFGALAGPPGDSWSPVQFASREYDEVTNLYYMRNRWYDPSDGRFITRDPNGLAGGANPYAYVENAPLTRVDPFGVGWKDWVKKIAAITPVTGAVVGGLIDTVVAIAEGKSAGEVAIEGLGGALEGAISALPIFKTGAGAALLSGLISAMKEVATQTLVHGKSFSELDGGEILTNALINAGAAGLVKKLGHFANDIVAKLGKDSKVAKIVGFLFDAKPTIKGGLPNIAKHSALDARDFANFVRGKGLLPDNLFDKKLAGGGRAFATRIAQKILQKTTGKILKAPVKALLKKLTGKKDPRDEAQEKIGDTPAGQDPAKQQATNNVLDGVDQTLETGDTGDLDQALEQALGPGSPLTPEEQQDLVDSILDSYGEAIRDALAQLSQIATRINQLIEQKKTAVKQGNVEQYKQLEAQIDQEEISYEEQQKLLDQAVANWNEARAALRQKK